MWATIESEIDTGVYRTEDYGKNWELVSDNQDLQGRPWYYQHIIADPSDENTSIEDEGILSGLKLMFK